MNTLARPALVIFATLWMFASAKAEEAKKAPPPTPMPGEQVTEEFFRYIIGGEVGIECRLASKRLVKYNIRAPGVMWGTTTGDSAYLRLTRWSTKVAADHTITIAGDDAEAQNGTGNWLRVHYTCKVDIAGETILSATIEGGKLP